MADDDFMFDDDGDEYGFEYEEDEGSEGGLGLENKYYNAKAQRDDFGVAMGEFQAIYNEDAGSSEWGFKATKQMIKLCLREAQLPRVLELYNDMLEFVRKNVVARNYAEKSINNMLERVSQHADTGFSREFYQRTLSVLKETQSDRLWLRTSLRLARVLLDQEQFGELAPLLESLRCSCQDDKGQLILERGTQLLEVNSVALSMYEAQQNAKQLKLTYLQCEEVRSAVPHPRIMGYIRECGGKIYMAEQNWAKAQSCFFDAFKNFDEAGSPLRVRSLKYLVLASMLSESEVNPLSSPEAKSYENEPSIRAISSLVRAYESHDVQAFESILASSESDILGDSFIGAFVEDLRRTFRLQALEEMVVPYTRIRIDTLAGLLGADLAYVEDLLISLILDRRIDGSIDQESGTLILHQETTDQYQYRALDKWATRIEELMRTSYGVLG
ncbi:hypothetical protein GGF46_005462 [Coemansia sp. RSA 552]|nr:hypothetical protein GGF46_005462 [Coemansia sp. RSA 552]